MKLSAKYACYHIVCSWVFKEVKKILYGAFTGHCCLHSSKEASPRLAAWSLSSLASVTAWQQQTP